MTIASRVMLAGIAIFSLPTWVHSHPQDQCDRDEYDLCCATTNCAGDVTAEGACAVRALWHCTLHHHGGSSGGDPTASDSFSSSAGASSPLAEADLGMRFKKLKTYRNSQFERP